MHAPDRVIRAEWNWNGGGDNIWFNLSGVDGVNANMTMSYTSCPSISTACNVQAKACPVQLSQIGSGSTCASAKSLAHCHDCGSIPGSSHTACELAGCGYSDASEVCECRRWWNENPCALNWCNYLRNNDCDMYCWAYDELVLKDSTATDCLNTQPNPKDPLRTCKKTADGDLIISITSVF